MIQMREAENPRKEFALRLTWANPSCPAWDASGHLWKWALEPGPPVESVYTPSWTSFLSGRLVYLQLFNLRPVLACQMSAGP